LQRRTDANENNIKPFRGEVRRGKRKVEGHLHKKEEKLVHDGRSTENKERKRHSLTSFLGNIEVQANGERGQLTAGA